jgi:hypothetical protein
LSSPRRPVSSSTRRQTWGLRGSGQTYPLAASFRSVEGIAVGTDVRLAGIKIGSVTALALDTESYRGAGDGRVDRGVQIPEDSDIRVRRRASRRLVPRDHAGRIGLHAGAPATRS